MGGICVCSVGLWVELTMLWPCAGEGVYVVKTQGDNDHMYFWLTTQNNNVHISFAGCTGLKVSDDHTQLSSSVITAMT